MNDPLIIGCAVLGLLIAVAQMLVGKFVWQQSPDLSVFIDVGLSTLLLYGAIRVCQITLSLPKEIASDEEKLYLLIAGLALVWLFVSGVIRKFKLPGPKQSGSG